MEEKEENKVKTFQFGNTIMFMPAHNVNRQIVNSLRFDGVEPQMPFGLRVISVAKTFISKLYRYIC